MNVVLIVDQRGEGCGGGEGVVREEKEMEVKRQKETERVCILSKKDFGGAIFGCKECFFLMTFCVILKRKAQKACTGRLSAYPC